MKNFYLVDTHTHLWHPEFHFDLKRVLETAIDVGVKYFINVGVDLETSQKAIKIAQRYKPVYATVGYHPHYARDFNGENKLKFKRLLKKKKIVALGEIGFDFYRQVSNKKTQFILLDEVLKIWAEIKNLPLIIHNREAHKEILSVLDNIKVYRPKIIMHCFSGDKNFLEECLKRGYFISYATNLTYDERLQELFKDTPLERILLETDSPYLAPYDKRGRRNEPAYLKSAIPFIVKFKELEEEDVIRTLALNAKVIFGIGGNSNFSKIVYK